MIELRFLIPDNLRPEPLLLTNMLNSLKITLKSLNHTFENINASSKASGLFEKKFSKIEEKLKEILVFPAERKTLKDRKDNAVISS